MWTPLFLLAFAGIVFGQSPWNINQEYTYNINARTLTSLPDLKNQYVGAITKGKLVLQVESEDMIVGKLMNMVNAHFHDNIEQDWNLQSAEKNLDFQKTNIDNLSFVMKLQQGVVRSISVDASLTNDQVNQLKAILSQLQIVKDEEYLIKRKFNKMPENINNNKPHGMYSVMEPTITGNCETVYDIEPVPSHSIENSYANWVSNKRSTQNQYQKSSNDNQQFQIVKTMNYSNCLLNRAYHYGIRGDSDYSASTNQIGNFFTKLFVTKILAKGNWNNFEIQNSYTTNRVAVSPTMYQNQHAEVLSEIQLTLAQTQPITQKLEKPSQMVNTGDLVYRRFNKPSDKDNKIVEEDEEQLQNYNNMMSRVRRSISIQQRTNENQIRSSATNQNYQRPQWYKSLSSSSEENVSMKRNSYYQPMSDMKHAPETPLYHYTVGNQGRSIRFDNNINVEKEAIKLSMEISNDVQNQNEIPERNTLQKFDILYDLIRTMDLEQIQNIKQQLGRSNERDEPISQVLTRKIFSDAVAVAGTGPAVSAVLNWISEKQVEDSEAQNLLEDTMRNVRLPTEEMMRTIFEFLTNDQVVQQDNELYSVGILGFTDLLRRSHTDKRSAFNHYPVHVFELRDEDLENLVTEKVIPHLTERLQQSVQMKNGQQILLNLRAIGNLGHLDTVRIYEDYLENNDKLTPFQRTALVLSMDRLVKLHPRLSSSVLFKIITNVADKPETRSVAVLLLMQANPTIVMLQRMAEMTHNDPSEAVQSIIKSAIESAAKLEDPKYAELANKAKNVKHLVNPKSFGYEHSKTYLRDYVAEEMNLIYKHQLSHIIGDDHIIPKGVIYQAFRNYGGLQMKTTEFQAMFSSVEELLKLLPGNEYDNHKHDRNNNNNFDQSKWSTHHIAEQLNIEPEVLKQLEGHILLKTLGRKKFFSFDEKTLKNLPKTISEYDLFKPQGQKLQFNKMYSRKQIVIAFPLATGYPFIYTFTMPTLLQAMGNVQIKTSPSIAQNPTWETIRSLEALNVTAKVHLVFSTDQIAKTGFITPFDRQRYVAGHVRKSYAHVPLNMKVDVDLKHGKISGKFTPIDSNKNFNLIEGSSWPFTLRKDVFDLRPAAEAKDLKLILTHQQHVNRQTLGEKSTGMAFNIYMEHHSSSNDRAQMSKTLWTQGMRSLASYPLSYKNLFQKISNNNGPSFWSFLPNSYQQPYYGNIGRNVIMSMASLPYMNELNMDEFIKMQGLLSLISLPFADVDSLEQAAHHSGVVKTDNLPWPRQTLDQYFYNIQYDASRSANQIVKFSIDIDHVYDADKRSFMASKRVQGPSSSDEKKLAIPVNAEPDNEERRQQFLENAAHGIKQASSSVLDMSVVFDGKKRTEYVATISQAYSPVDEKERVLIFLSAKPIKPSAVQQIAVTSTARYPKNSILNFEEALKNKDNSNVKAHIYIGENLQSNPTYVNIKADLEQTEEYRHHLVHENSDGRRCKQATSAGKNQIPACLNAIYWADFQDYVKISAEVENPNKDVENIMREILRTVQQIGFWNLEEDRNVRTNPNHFETTLRISPHMNSVNLSIVTENKKYMLKDLDVDRSLWLFLSDENLHNRHQKNKREDRHICALDENVITTFDRNVFNNQIGKCWYAMLQTKINERDNSNAGPREVSVLVRENNNDPEQVDLMVVVAQKVGKDHVIQLQAGNSKVQVNGQERKLSSDQSVDVFDNDDNEETAVRVYQQVKGEYVVQLEENLMNIYYDGKRIRIHMDPRYRANTYGLCGTFTGEKFDDFVTPQKCVMRNEKFFTSSWALTEEESCSSEIKQIKDQVQNMPCNKIQYYSGKFVNRDETRQNTRKSSGNTSGSSSSEENNNRQQNNQKSVDCNLKQQVQFIENGDKICFTSDVLSACPSHCTAQRKEKQRVAVHCRNIHDSVAQLYKQQILSGANPDLSSRPVSKQLTFNVPTKCTYLN